MILSSRWCRVKWCEWRSWISEATHSSLLSPSTTSHNPHESCLVSRRFTSLGIWADMSIRISWPRWDGLNVSLSCSLIPQSALKSIFGLVSSFVLSTTFRQFLLRNPSACPPQDWPKSCKCCWRHTSSPRSGRWSWWGRSLPEHYLCNLNSSTSHDAWLLVSDREYCWCPFEEKRDHWGGIRTRCSFCFLIKRDTEGCLFAIENGKDKNHYGMWKWEKWWTRYRIGGSYEKTVWDGEVGKQSLSRGIFWEKRWTNCIQTSCWIAAINDKFYINPSGDIPNIFANAGIMTATQAPEPPIWSAFMENPLYSVIIPFCFTNEFIDLK